MWRRRRSEGEEPAAPTFATTDDLGGGDYRDVPLPFLGKQVRVRYLASPEVARLQHLPDLLGYSEKALKIMRGEGADVDEADMAAEQLVYYAHLVHLAVVDPTAPAADGELPEPVICAGCSGEKVQVSHPPSLWSAKHAQRLQPTDLNAIIAVALSAQGRFADLGPFSRARRRRGSRSRADTGE